ncbi:MAG: hypothetical protein ACLFVU_10650, partial [Phycisphaerae bacterium]
MKRIAIAAVLSAVVLTQALAEKATVLNPTGREYKNELVRLDAKVPDGDIAIVHDGEEVPHQVEVIDGKRVAWVLVDMPATTRMNMTIEKRKPTTAFKLNVKVTKDGDRYVMDNGLVAVKVPAAAEGKKAPSPITAVRLPGGKWIGKGFFQHKYPLKKFSAEIVGDGTLFGKIRLKYEFDGKAGFEGDVPAYAIVDVRLAPGHHHVRIEEEHEMLPKDFWEFDVANGWAGKKAMVEIYGGGAGKATNRAVWPTDLTPLGWDREAIEKRYETSDPRIGNTLLWLIPRWNQHYKDGWFFAAHDDKQAAGAIVCRVGEWLWPHQNAIEVKAKPSADYAGLRCSTWKGRRYWLLTIGPKETFDGGKHGGNRAGYVQRYAMQPLDKLNQDYILTWPGFDGKKLGKFRGEFFYSSGINPTGFWRSMSRNAMRSAGKGSGNLSTLTHVQVMLDPDMYGSYWNYTSPENPNFFTDFIKRPIGEGTNLRNHPRFKEIAKQVEQKLREDLYHSVTLPGGAGQECPGYLSHAIHQYKAMAPICKKYYGFDPTDWPRYKAAQQFLYKLSQPRGGGGRVFHPGGDTHPGKSGPKSAEGYRFGNPKKWTTEELPGFGVILRNNCGTGKETYMAFKSGPNRGHYHGDQLSFHLCMDAKPIAVDHHVSYAPRAGQEHMHNRVWFSSDKFDYANMDGYERVIALKTGDQADVAIGQVESERIREVKKHPPEAWHADHPQQRFDDNPLKYRRTVVLVKGQGGEDYFVLRDQYAGPKLTAHYMVHTLGKSIKRNGQSVDMGNLKLFVASPKEFKFGTFPWSHSKAGGQTTNSPDIQVTGEKVEFVTVLHRFGDKVKIESIDGGVRVGSDEIAFGGGIDDEDGVTYATVKRDGKTIQSVTGKDIDMERSQGEIGLFVPDAGYPFGRIPDWLIRQRSETPDWAPEWAKEV